MELNIEDVLEIVDCSIDVEMVVDHVLICLIVHLL